MIYKIMFEQIVTQKEYSVATVEANSKIEALQELKEGNCIDFDIYDIEGIKEGDPENINIIEAND